MRVLHRDDVGWEEGGVANLAFQKPAQKYARRQLDSTWLIWNGDTTQPGKLSNTEK